VERIRLPPCQGVPARPLPAGRPRSSERSPPAGRFLLIIGAASRHYKSASLSNCRLQGNPRAPRCAAVLNRGRRRKFITRHAAVRTSAGERVLSTDLFNSDIEVRPVRPYPWRATGESGVGGARATPDLMGQYVPKTAMPIDSRPPGCCSRLPILAGADAAPAMIRGCWGPCGDYGRQTPLPALARPT